MTDIAQPPLFSGEAFRAMADSGTGSQISPSLRRELGAMCGDCCGHARGDHRGGECRICRILGRGGAHDFG